MSMRSNLKLMLAASMAMNHGLMDGLDMNMPPKTNRGGFKPTYKPAQRIAIAKRRKANKAARIARRVNRA